MLHVMQVIVCHKYACMCMYVIGSSKGLWPVKKCHQTFYNIFEMLSWKKARERTI